MHSMLISKVDKANRYAHEPDRFHFQAMTMMVDGDNASHQVTLNDQGWTCNCHLFDVIGGCAHVLAIQKMFGSMLAEPHRTALFDHLENGMATSHA